MERYQNTVYIEVPTTESNTKGHVRTADIPMYSRRKKRVSTTVTYKRWKGTTAALDEQVLRVAELLVSQRNGGYRHRFCAEAIAYNLSIQVQFIKQSLHRLNLAGKVSQPSRHHAHDTNRAPFFYGGSASGWAANVYSLR
jgi:hypothetical protein